MKDDLIECSVKNLSYYTMCMYFTFKASKSTVLV